MNVKIQGGNGTYTNSGSCINVAYYLEHEDYHRMKDGLPIEPFFCQDKGNIQKNVFVLEMDNNKAKLCKKDAKFFVITISPSKEEIEKMGHTPQEQSNTFKQFIRNQVIPHYAAGFNKKLTANDIMYFAKIHHTRKDKTESQMHCHIVISRKTKDNKLKISPKTNHKKAQTAGTVQSGFDRTQFYQNIEESFDKMFNYKRPLQEKFEYLNTLKNGTISELEQVLKLVCTPSEIIKPVFMIQKDLKIIESMQTTQKEISTEYTLSKTGDIQTKIIPSGLQVNNTTSEYDDDQDQSLTSGKRIKPKKRNIGRSI